MRSFIFFLAISVGCGVSAFALSSEKETFVVIAKAPVALETCFSPNGNCDQKLIAFINSAQWAVDMAIYNLTHKGIVQALENARNRGVKVRLVVDRREAEMKNSLIQHLHDAGFQIKFGNVPERGLMHNKFTIVDRKMVETGSYNYTMTATEKSFENQIYLTDAQVVERYAGAFVEIWNDGIPVPHGFVADKEYEKCPDQPPKK